MSRQIAETIERDPGEVVEPELSQKNAPHDDKAARIEQAVKQAANLPTRRIDVFRVLTNPVSGEAHYPEGATFHKTPKGYDGYRRWLGEEYGTANHWIYPNDVNPEITLGETKRDGKIIHKAKELDIVAVNVVQRDRDPKDAPKELDADAMAAHYAAECGRAINELMADDEYAIVLCSGGGAQGFKIYSEPVTDPAKFAECKARNVANGESVCQSIDHVFRITGLPNIPNKKKRNIGREISRPYMLRFDDGTRRIDPAGKLPALSRADRPARTSSGNKEVPIDRALVKIGPVADFDARVSETGKLIQAHGGDLATLNAIRTEANSLNRPYASNSDMGQGLVRCMVAAGFTPEQIAGHVLDPNNPAGIHFREQKDAYRAVGRSIGEARRLDQEGTDDVDPDLLRLNEKYAVVPIGKDTVVIHFQEDSLGNLVPVLQSFDSFKKLLMNERKQTIVNDRNGKPTIKEVYLGDWWLAKKTRRQFNGGIVYRPDIDSAVVGDAMNLWRGFAVQPIAGNKHELFLDHIRENLCNGSPILFAYLVRWMAFVIQKRGERTNVAVILRSTEEGTGKTFFGEHYSVLLGQHARRISQDLHLDGKFNVHLQSCSVLCAAEAGLAANGRKDGPLKALVTDPTIRVEPKGIDSYEVRNHLNFIFDSNEEQVIKASETARRWFILNVSKRRMGDVAYFDNIRTDLNSGGYQSLLHYLLNLDLTGFNVRDVPKTDALGEQKDMS